MVDLFVLFLTLLNGYVIFSFDCKLSSVDVLLLLALISGILCLDLDKFSVSCVHGWLHASCFCAA